MKTTAKHFESENGKLIAEVDTNRITVTNRNVRYPFNTMHIPHDDVKPLIQFLLEVETEIEHGL
jgi:hypothetical protein